MPYQGTNAGAKKELADLGFFEKGTRGTVGTRREGGMFLQNYSDAPFDEAFEKLHNEVIL